MAGPNMNQLVWMSCRNWLGRGFFSSSSLGSCWRNLRLYALGLLLSVSAMLALISTVSPCSWKKRGS